MWADADSSCTESCTDSWRRWLGSLCGQAARRILRSSCCATNSACCAARSTDPNSPTPTGARSERSRPRYRDRAEPGGWSPPTHCCVGTAAASPGTGLNHSDRRAGHRPQRSFADSRCASQPRIQPGDTDGDQRNSPELISEFPHLEPSWLSWRVLSLGERGYGYAYTEVAGASFDEEVLG